MCLMATSTQQRGRGETAGSSCHLEPLQTNPSFACSVQWQLRRYTVTALPGTLVSGHLHPVLRPASRASCVLPCLVNWSFPCPFEVSLTTETSFQTTSTKHHRYIENTPHGEDKQSILFGSYCSEPYQLYRRTSLRISRKQSSPLASHPRHKMVSLPDHYNILIPIAFPRNTNQIPS